MTFGEKLQSLRKKAGFSQEDLAEKLDITRQTVSKWELDQSTPELRAAKPAPKGAYRLHSAGEAVIDPDFTSVWTVTDEPEEK